MRQNKINYVGVLAAVGGMLGFVGIYLNWWYYSFPLSGVTFTQGIRGIDDWSGVAAMAAAIGTFAFGAAYVLLDDPTIRKITGALMGIGSLFLLGMSIVGMFRSQVAVGVPALPEGVTRFARGLSGGAFVSMVGGVVALVATILMLDRDATPASAGAV